jgi:hypothetical protein
MFGLNHFSTSSHTVSGFYSVQTLAYVAVSWKSFVAFRYPVILLSIFRTQNDALVMLVVLSTKETNVLR